MIDLTRPEIAFALAAVREASDLTAHVRREMVTDAITKDDRSPVTIADYGAQALVGRRLREAFPEDPLVGEEDSSALKSDEQRAVLEPITGLVARYEPSATPESVCAWIDYGSAESGERFWTVDPVDGTKGFLRGGHFAVALALVIDDQVELGVLGTPHLSDPRDPDALGSGSLTVAARGQGTWMVPSNGSDPVRLRVSAQSDPTQARLFGSVEAGHTNPGQIGQLISTLEVEVSPVRMDSQAKYVVLAAGGGDLLLRLISSRAPDYREKIWDQAAGSLVLEEAGGTITDLDGKPLDFSHGRTLASNRGICASNGELHEAALAALRAIEA